MLLSLPVSFTLHIACPPPSLLQACTHENTCPKEKVIVSTFTLPHHHQSPLPCREDLHALFSPPGLLCRDCPPVQILLPSSSLPPPCPCTNTADRRWRRCYDTVACRPTNPSQSLSQKAPSGLVCIFETVLSSGACAYVCFMDCVYASCSLRAHLRLIDSPVIIYNYIVAVCSTDLEESSSIIGFKKEKQ